MFRFIAPLLACVLLLTSRPASAVPGVGDTVPNLTFETILNAPDDAAVEFDGNLKGKVVVLEFWATWCGPCVAAIPHMNELTEQFADDDVQFIAINVGETRDTVETFLKRRGIDGWVALDEHEAVANQFEVSGIPRTIVIGRDGRIVADTYPTMLQAEHLRKALAGEPLGLPERQASPLPAVEALTADDDNALIQVALTRRDNTDGNQNIMFNGKGAIFNNVTAKTLLTNAANNRFSGNRVMTEATPADADARYDLVVQLAEGDREAAMGLLWDTVSRGFNVTATAEDREVDVLVLQPIRGAESKLPAMAESGDALPADQFGADRVVMDQMATTPASVARTIEMIVRQPVLSDWKPAGVFDLRVELPGLASQLSPEEKLAAINSALAEHGLELIAEQRTLPYTVIRNAE